MIRPALGFGVQIACEGMSWPECLDIARTAERCGYSSLWVPDHYVATPDGISGDIRTPLLDGWTTLGAIAHETSRLRLGPLVASNTFRPPAILAKMIASLDHISGGRIELGMGAGWFEFEHTSYGIPFPELPERLRALEEAVQIIKALFTEEQVDFQGDFYQLQGAVLEPKALQSPHPPLVIGASGEKVALRNAARHADHWNTYAPPQLFRHKNQVLDEHCAAVSRNPEEITRSVMMPLYLDEDEAVRAKVERWGGQRDWFLIGNKQEISEKIEKLVEAGAELLIVQVDRTGRCAETLERFSEEFPVTS
ncbi:LLM class F420-dependent oxidoreductase [Myxococcota bacterium]|nr:LLM class F420-dependent oxidoreductase [Myxococcota bacterium]